MAVFETELPARRVWAVSGLCRALADTLDARFNPVRVTGELASFTRASSGHCYFTLKDAQAQLRCAMFKRAATLLDFAPREGELVELSGRLDVYGPRGDLQLIVESMTRQGQGNLFEQFMRLKAALEAEGLFDVARKRPLPAVTRTIGLVTSLGAAALHDVVTALRRRAPHVQVILAPALVQGEGAAPALVQALESLYRYHATLQQGLDAILLVRGGGSMEDLWAFNDATLARTIAESPVPVLSGVGHETDFTIADFVADVRAPTPTAAAEMVSTATQQLHDLLERQQSRLQAALERVVDRQSQRLDGLASRLGRPSSRVTQRSSGLASLQQRMLQAAMSDVQWKRSSMQHLQQGLLPSLVRAHQIQRERATRASLRLELLDPSLVLRRGYAWLSDTSGQAVTCAALLKPGQHLRATLADGAVDVLVAQQSSN
ncbi:MAG: exodeoxyribonuclease VII large subunit [Curvibacter sp.]|nr:MAG: exodeoxyribonuclease VII large subunit [Curvibacter sp.]